MSTRARKITRAQLERTIGILGTVAENADLTGSQRDDFASVIDVLDQLSEAGDVRIDTRRWDER